MSVILEDGEGNEVRALKLGQWASKEVTDYLRKHFKDSRFTAVYFENIGCWSLSGTLHDDRCIKTLDNGEGIRVAIEELYNVAQVYLNKGLKEW